MKRNVLFSLAAAAFIVSGCSNDELLQEVINSNNVTLHATMVDAENSRVALTDDEGAFSWSKGDQISVYTTTPEFRPFILSGEGGEALGTFTGGLPTGAEVSKYAVYPHGGHSVVNDKLTFKMADSYNYVEGVTNVPMLAEIAEGSSSLEFKHLGGVFRFTISNIPVGTKHFVFTANSKINGNFELTKNDDNKNIIKTSTTTVPEEKTVTIILPTATTEVTTQTFYIPVPVGTYEGMTLEFTDDLNDVLTTIPSDATNTVTRTDIIKIDAACTEVTGGSGTTVSDVDAFKQKLQAGGEIAITLSNDLTFNEALTVPANATLKLNLNGKTLTANQFVVSSSADATFFNGKLSLTNDVNLNSNSIALLKNVELTSQETAIRSAASTLTIENSTIKTGTGGTGIILTEANTLIVKGTSTIEHAHMGITQNGNVSGSTISVSGTTITGKYSGIYLSSQASGAKNTLTVDNCNITSTDESAIEVKKTDITVKNSTLASQATTQSYSLSNGGSNGKGYGIVLAGYGDGTIPYEGATTFENNSYSLASNGEVIYTYMGVRYNESAKTYSLVNKEGLMWFSRQATEENKTFFSGMTIELTSDIDLTGESWSPCMIWNSENPATFNGNNKTIKNLKGTNGLFGAGSTVNIKNLTINGAEISGEGSFKGAIAGNLYGNLENCHVKDVTINTPEGIRIGGMIGIHNSGDMNECSATDVTIKGLHSIAALVGFCNETKDRTYTSCMVNGAVIQNMYAGNYQTGYQKHGSIVGSVEEVNQLTLKNCSATGCTYTDKDGAAIQPIHELHGYTNATITIE